MILKLALIAIGGGIGTVSRYLLAGLVHGGYARLTAPGSSASALAVSFPLGTLVVNIVGCLAIGVFAAFFAGPHLVRDEYRLAIMVGLLGGFTTFSTFGFETIQLFNDALYSRALMNILLMNTACLFAVWIGYRLTERIVGIT